MYTVGQCARILNVSAKTLRHYDAVGLVGPARVGDENQYRYYSREQLPLLRRIVFLRGLGLGLEVIRELVRAGALDDAGRLRAILEEHAAGIQREMEVQRERLGEIERAMGYLESEVVEAGPRGVVVKRVPEIRTGGVRRAIHLRELEGLFREAEGTLTRPPSGPRICVYYNPEFDPELVDVEVLYPTDGPVAAGSERILPAVTVAAILQVGLESVEEIGAAYGAVYDWIEAHGTRDVGPPREVLLVGRDSGKPPSEYVMEIQVPIESVK